MSALDGSVVNTILPVLREAFSSSIASIEWVITVYLLILSGLLLSFGRLGDLRGHKNVYLLGFLVFITSSALCGLASSVVVLVIFRSVQALGGAMLAANSPAILTKSFPARQRGQALGLLATMTYLGLTVGPSLGGWLTDQFSWRAVFYINIPVGLVAFILSLRFIDPDTRSTHNETFDFIGAALISGRINRSVIWSKPGAGIGLAVNSNNNFHFHRNNYSVCFLVGRNPNTISDVGFQAIYQQIIHPFGDQRYHQLYVRLQYHFLDAILSDTGIGDESIQSRSNIDRYADYHGYCGAH